MELTNGSGAFKLTEAFDGVDIEDATFSLIRDGEPRLHVETLANGQSAWTYDIFFTGPHLANVPELVIVDEGTGTYAIDNRLKAGKLILGRRRYSTVYTRP